MRHPRILLQLICPWHVFIIKVVDFLIEFGCRSDYISSNTPEFIISGSLKILADPAGFVKRSDERFGCGAE